ncbi:MAG: hypothetical protein ACRDPL_00145 [Propionibacteriaceae bacterium]
MRKLISITALAAVATTAFAVPSVASAADQARFGNSLVTGFPVAPAQGLRPAVETAYTHWSGRINAQSSTCAYKRLITVWEVRPGADRKLGSTRGKRFAINGTVIYDWSFKKVGYLAKTGRTYAKMAATSKCQEQRSGKFFVRVTGGSR